MNRSILPRAALCAVAGLLWLGSAIAQNPQDPEAILRAALEQWRGSSSYSEMTMIIHRPDWERRMSMRGWTQGEDRSLVRVTAPARDAGSGTLLVKNDMWTYAPNINRVIKVPSSMMGQSWMGSDFSNKDIARGDDIIEQYEHRLLRTDSQDGHQVYHIEARPHETAAVVWGREVLQIREDYVLLRHDFYDQNDKLVKSLITREIGTMGGREVARVQRMINHEKPEEWTEVRVDAIDFDVDLSDRLFTQSSLRNPRQ